MAGPTRRRTWLSLCGVAIVLIVAVATLPGVFRASRATSPGAPASPTPSLSAAAGTRPRSATAAPGRRAALHALARLLAHRHPGGQIAHISSVEVARGSADTWWVAGSAFPASASAYLAVAVKDRDTWRLRWCGADARSCRAWMAPRLYRQLFPSTDVNWAGYYVASGHFTSVRATWKQPRIAASRDYQLSVWVGLDGSRDVDQVEQTGTMWDRHSSVAFYEMVPRPPFVGGVAIRPGDTISAAVRCLGRHRFRLTLFDHTRQVRYSLVRTDPAALCASAEIVVEGHGTAHGLAPFTTVDFTDCLVNGRPLGAFDPTKVEIVDDFGSLETCTSSVSVDGLSFTVARQ